MEKNKKEEKSFMCETVNSFFLNGSFLQIFL